MAGVAVFGVVCALVVGIYCRRAEPRAVGDYQKAVALSPESAAFHDGPGIGGVERKTHLTGWRTGVLCL